MKRYILSAVAMATLLTCFANNKLDAGSRAAIGMMRQKVESTGLTISSERMLQRHSAPSRGDADLCVLVTLNDGYSANDIAALVDEVTLDLGTIVAANVSLDAIDAIAESDAVKSLQLSRTHKPMLDKTREGVNVVAVHNGSDAALPQAFRGAGVITGIYDTGMDPNHPNFLAEDGLTRVSRLWNYTRDNGTFTRYETRQAIKGFTTDNRQQTHGTQTLGCMAGSYNGPGRMGVAKGLASKVEDTDALPFYGMAPEADIVVGCGSLADANILSALQNAVNYAKAENKPLVFNLSIGQITGPHDGTDAFSQALNKFSNDAVVCVAIGNEAGYNNTISRTLTADNNSIKTIIDGEQGSYNAYLDIWASDDREFTVTPVVIDVTSGEILYSLAIPVDGNGDYYITTNNYTSPNYIHDENFNKYFTSSYVAVSSSLNEGTNNRRQAMVSAVCRYNAAFNADHNVRVGVIISGAEGQRIDLINDSDDSQLSDGGLKGWIAGTGEFSISDMATNPAVISVGAWNTRYRWVGMDGMYYSAGSAAEWPIGDVASFSSRGTLLDGRSLPTICAPGSGIITSSSYYFTALLSKEDRETFAAKADLGTRTYYWDADFGTSLATPIVSGGIALWLQADHTLSPERVREVIVESAAKDNFTQNNPVAFGAGKFDVLAGLKIILNDSGVGPVAADSPTGLVLTAKGANSWEAFVAGSRATSVEIFDAAGHLYRSYTTSGDTAAVDGSTLPKGVYVLRVNGAYTSRILVK